MRVVLFRVADGATLGQNNRDMATHEIPIWEAQKQAGLIVDYQTFFNTGASSENDWRFGFSITYENWAALDGFFGRANEFANAHYGSPEARRAANQARNRLRVQVSNQMVFARTYAPSR